MKFKLKQLNIIPRRRGWILLLLGIISLSFFIPTLALADIGVAIAQIMSQGIIMIVNFLVGTLLTFLIGTLVEVAQYNNFINSPAVSKGWIIIRDLFNILFVIILLIIAFATVLKLERYHYKRMLASFLIAAVLVNFSKLISGILIDITQVIMLTFVKAFQDAATGNFIEMLGLTRLLSVDSDVAAAAGEDFFSVIGATLLGLIMAIVSTVVVGIILFVFVFRIVMIWILVILSPLAFMATVLPATQGYGRQWWQKFTNQLIIGPILAFFLWLSLAIVQDPGTDPNSLYQKEPSPGTEVPGQLTEASQPQYMLNFVLGISMLIGSLMVTQQLGVAGANMAGRAVTKMQGMATGLVKGTTKLGFKGARRAITTAGETLQAKTGLPIMPSKIKEEYAKARGRITRRREAEYRSKRALISDQWERHGWIGGTRRYIQDAMGAGKEQITSGQKNIDSAEDKQGILDKSLTSAEKVELKKDQGRFVDDRNRSKSDMEALELGKAGKSRTLTQDEKIELKKDYGQFVDDRNRSKSDMEALNTRGAINTQRFIPLINNSIKGLETQADDADAKGDTKKAKALRDEADRVKKIVPVIGQKDRFNWQEVFKGNDKLEASVKSQIQTDLDTSQNDIEDINVALKAERTCLYHSIPRDLFL
ncbi:hypothetical protein IID20_04075 [Patescibacteria group bacterium]|nr:hypothetical protein [Patescibacteria group bacterium]